PIYLAFFHLVSAAPGMDALSLPTLFRSQAGGKLLGPDMGQQAVGLPDDPEIGLGKADAQKIIQQDGGAYGKGIAFPRLLVQIGKSEEHTSELQSRDNLVCRLLLEKKKNN